MKVPVTLKINGDTYELAVAPWHTLNQVLRDDLGLVGTKLGCGTGDCGACTVIVDGRSVVSCLSLAVEMENREITTIEGLARSGEELHPVQQAFVDKGAIQCGYCTTGMEMSAAYLLDKNPDPSTDEIRHALGGNLCRCTGYYKIIDAVSDAAEIIRSEKAGDGTEAS